MWSALVSIVKIGVSRVMELVRNIRRGKRTGMNVVKSLDQNEEQSRIGKLQNPQLESGNTISFSRCKRCGRLLKDPESQRLGYGRVCLEKIKKDQSNRLF